MKDLKTLGILLITLAYISSCNSKRLTEPEHVGNKVFGVLESISIKSKKEYLKNFLSIEKLRELAKNEKIVTEEKARNRLTSITKTEWEDRIFDDYNNFKENGIAYEINWKNIEYLDFIYETKDFDGIKTLEGYIYFKHLDNSFRISIIAFWIGAEYKIVEIDDLRNG